MNNGIYLVIFLSLFFIGLTVADSISSSIVSDGAAFVSSSVIGAGETYAARLFNSGNGSIMRDLAIGPGNRIQAGITAGSSGPLGIDEYSLLIPDTAGDIGSCIFIIPVNRTGGRNEVLYTGLMNSGIYYSSRNIDRNLTAMTMINGTGIILGRAESKDRNRTVNHKTDVAGSMNLTELIVFGRET